MLCAGVVHGDLSEFNILLGVTEDASEDKGLDSGESLGELGPVIIDLPQAIDAAGNNHAQRMLLRDVNNLRDFFGCFAPELLHTDYGAEMWDLYQRGLLQTSTVLTGQFKRKHAPVDVRNVMREIDDTREEEVAKRLRQAMR